MSVVFESMISSPYFEDNRLSCNMYHKCHIASSAIVCRFLILVELGATVLSACAGEQYGISATYKASVYLLLAVKLVYIKLACMLTESRKYSASNLSQIPLKWKGIYCLSQRIANNSIIIIVLKMHNNNMSEQELNHFNINRQVTSQTFVSSQTFISLKPLLQWQLTGTGNTNKRQYKHIKVQG